MRFYLWFLLGSFVCVGGAFFVGNYSHSGEPREHVRVVCTTSMLTDAVRVVGGRHVEAIGLMGPGVDPHLYRAREGDVHLLAGAELVLYLGLHLECKMGYMLATMNTYTPTVGVCDWIEKDHLRVSTFAGMYDPHVWHDVRLWIKIVMCVRDSLIALDPLHAAAYERNAAHYLEQLQKLHQFVLEKITTIPLDQRVLVTAHDAFAYFGAVYGLEVVALQGISTESDIATKDVIDLAAYIVQNKVPAIFLESSIPARNIQAVQHAVAARGWQVELGDELFSDALGDKQSGADTYVRMIEHNTRAIVRSLKSMCLSG